MRCWRSARTAAVVAAVGVLLLGGCGTGAAPYGPTGVDELVVPTPSPRPNDFVARIDNAWLPLPPGRSRTYDVTRPGHAPGVRTVTVLRATVPIDGIGTTAVSTVLTRPGERALAQIDYYAQDRDGNVWWFGRRGLWRAGEQGARAGLVLTSTPRLGDGYRAGYEKGRVEDVISVAHVASTVWLDRTSALSPGTVVRDTLRRGIGVVERLDTGTGERDTLRPGK